ncbi:MAG: YciI family protein [Ferrovibrio sp.]|uniref:YciI family protein n=1 Tax=Ferrovibrio sp. TaxID=1917215 RepID=UPI0026149869|nr:YciI family protein [Ferrovibrio sp.]MCW0233169.1 YciI family protein [Ferrovibrio sp.]
MPKPRPVYWIDYQRGPAWPAEQPAPKQALHDHQIYLQRLMETGKLLIAGLFRDAAGGGIAVLDSSDEAAARRMMEDDPAVRSGLLQATLRPWQMVFNLASDTSPFAEDAADGRARG